MIARVAAAAFFLAACTPSIPEGQLVCTNAARECPSGWVCAGGFCYSSSPAEFDASVDASLDVDGGLERDAFLEEVDASTESATLVAIAAGGDHSCALTSTNRVFCWGRNDAGQLGDGTRSQRLSAVETSTELSLVVEICAGAAHTCARTDAGEIWCWGDNEQAQVGDPAETSYDVARRIIELGATDLTCGARHTCAIVRDEALCWGTNTSGQLGDETLEQRRTPTAVHALESPQSIAAGGGHTCAIDGAGNSWCWGRNTAGQLGDIDSPLESQTSPRSVDLSVRATELAVGAEHTCARLEDGSVVCWGAAGQHRLGDQPRDELYRPRPGVPVALPGSPAAITVGGHHACVWSGALNPTCWGRNADGELGIGRVTFLVGEPPTEVVGALSELIAVAAGAQHTCAVEATRAFCWGSNMRGQLGNLTTDSASQPVLVTGIDLSR